jgi:FHA domain
LARFALTWTDDGRPFAVDLDPTRDHVIGRDPTTDIVISRPTVSRRHAVLHGLETWFTVENASSTNPTRLAGTAIAGATRLENGAEIDTGGRRSLFWDLAAGDRLSGPICSHCGHENSPRDDDCWFCGTSLVNAPTEMRRTRHVVCRLVDADGDVVDLLEEHALRFAADGRTASIAAQPASQDAGIAIVDGRPVVRDGRVAAEAGDGSAIGDRPLATGDVVRSGPRTYVVIVR